MPRNPETSQQINILDDGSILPGNYPDPVEQSSIDMERRWRDRNGEKDKADFQRVVDASELNDTYAEPLAEAKEYFAREGIEIAPLRMISRDTYKDLAATQQVGSGDADGLYVHDRAVIVENERAIELLGEGYVLDVALHEAAHSIGTMENERVIYLTTPESIGKRAVSAGDMKKIDLRDESNKYRGHFWEEGFADLTRVRAMRALDHTRDIREATLHDIQGEGDTKVWVVPNDSDSNNRTGIAIPGEFTSSNSIMAISSPNFAAYTLELLDQRTPGLYEDLKAARTNPLRQRDAIHKIESVQPGLYRKLRDLEDSEEDFVQGLASTLKALELPPYNNDI